MKIILLLTICFSVIAVNAQTDAVKVPAEVKSFVESGTKAIALESADLNGDGMMDFILVLEKANPTEMDEADFPENERPLLILVRGKDKKLSVVKRNENIVMCSQCGGVFGDPFAGVDVAKNTFTVRHYGGSAWRWTADYQFNYSKIDKTWQLVRIERTSYHNVRPMEETLEKTVLTPPKDFGKVDIADFDPSDYDEVPEVTETSETPKNTTKIKFAVGAYSSQTKGKFTKANESVYFSLKAAKDQQMIVNIYSLTDGLGTSGVVISPSGEEDGQPGGLVFNSILPEDGEYKIRVSQRPTDHKFPAEFIVEVIILPKFISEDLMN